MMMTREDALLKYVLRLGDNALVLSQRLIEIVTHGPELEEEMANANFALDYLGQARMLYSYAGEIEGRGRTEDEFAYMRDEREFSNFLLVEQPNGHFGDTIARSVLFEYFYIEQLARLEKCADARLAEIAARAIKEIRYHLRHNSQWLIRLGDGTELSHQRIQQSVDKLWRYTGEMFAGDEIDELVRNQLGGPDLGEIRKSWDRDINEILSNATLQVPDEQWMDEGGRAGCHSEYFGSLIAEMQYMQRSFPGLNW